MELLQAAASLSSWCDMVWHHPLLGNREGLKPLLVGF